MGDLHDINTGKIIDDRPMTAAETQEMLDQMAAFTKWLQDNLPNI